MNPPFSFISNNIRKPVFVIGFAWVLILTVVSQLINAPLTNSTTPAGIVSFELARNPYSAQSMVNSWDGQSRQSAAFGLGFDYLFMPSYAFALSLACLLAAGRHHGIFSMIGAWLGWAALLAALFDAVENIGLWYSLLGNFNFLWPEISFWCAVLKFSLIMLGIAFSLIGWILPKNSS